jgi:DNA-binding response OmpR family regulator
MTKPGLLFVDDSDMMRQFLLHYFSKEYQVHAAADADEAWKCLESGLLPVLIVLDLRMPGSSGLELLAKLKCSAQFAPVPVIFLSSVDESHERLACLQAGAADYVVKPFNPKELEHRIKFQLSISKAA